MWQTRYTRPRLLVEHAYNISMSSYGELADSLLGGIDLNYIFHRECVRKASAGVIKERKRMKIVDLGRRKVFSRGQYILVPDQHVHFFTCSLILRHHRMSKQIYQFIFEIYFENLTEQCTIYSFNSVI